MDREGDFWRFTTRSMHDLARESFEEDQFDVRAWGNVLACVGFLHGLAQEDLREDEIDACDPDFQLIVSLRAWVR